MVVLGRNCSVFDWFHRRTFDVELFDPSIRTAKKVPIVDDAVAYTCAYTHETYVQISRNVLYVLSTDNNLIPFFILWQAGVNVSDTPKIYLPDP